MKEYHVYIMSSLSGVLYIGVTNDLTRRVSEHKSGIQKGFTERYKCTLLVYCESFQYVNDAISREKQLKNWGRTKKMNLIKSMNPAWKDLST